MKISSINNFPHLKNKFLHLKKLKPKTAIPIVTTPILLHSNIKKIAKDRAKKIIEEELNSKKYNSSHHPVTDKTEVNEKALESAGIKKK